MADGALTKADMAERLFEELGLNKREAKEVVEQFFEEIRLSLERNEQVKLSGYGNFDLRDKNNVPAVTPNWRGNPYQGKTGSDFSARTKLKARVEGYAGSEE